ncbi:CatB-related O-acetyltransferase [Sulfitobacter sp. F26204]|uniref:CatB-related O-acetyltransferase n=1 Tax=Sulfitobacter sp. F26204 TaxID=2996014 RepID=UPI00225E6C9D|nr:CatB-related O-acetyltransferase [Sulfitobacter sp. F26204]MCX7561876.1 CatB-related O-acetyltransferase [Sulfitobacter sp. F26204]
MSVSSAGHFAPPTTLHPISKPDGTPDTGTVFLSAAVDHPRLDVGDYTYASAFDPPEDWCARLAPYLFDFSPERLVIGKFCQIADGVTFITASANHRFDGISSYPFAIFDCGVKQGRPSLPGPGRDTVIGNDVWFGQGVRILPGAEIGNGVIIGAGAVVGGKIADYTIVAGNPARPIRQRFPALQVAQLKRIAWWDWPIETVLAHEKQIMEADVAALAAVAPQSPP